jgi:hypothetical protein
VRNRRFSPGKPFGLRGSLGGELVHLWQQNTSNYDEWASAFWQHALEAIVLLRDVLAFEHTRLTA